MKSAWPIKNLEAVLEIQNGYAFDSRGFNPTEGMPLVRIRSLKTGTENETMFSGDYDEKYIVNDGDLLIGMDGEFGCYEWRGGKALLNQRVCRLQGFKADLLLPRFLFYGVNTYLKAIEDVTGFATVKHISSKQILGIKFPLPPIHEQQRIVAILDQAFEGIAKARANAEQNLKNARALFESHLQSVFTQRGEGWEKKTLADLSKSKSAVVSGPFGSNLKVSDYKNEGVPILRLQNIGKGYFIDKSIKFITEQKAQELSYHSFESGDVALAKLGIPIGKTCIIPAHFKSGIITADIVRIRPDKNVANYKFLEYFLNTDLAVNQLTKNISGATRPRVNLSDVRDIELNLPPLNLQEKIVTEIDLLAKETQRLEVLYQRKIACLDELKKSLLQQAFSGEL